MEQHIELLTRLDQAIARQLESENGPEAFVVALEGALEAARAGNHGLALAFTDVARMIEEHRIQREGAELDIVLPGEREPLSWDLVHRTLTGANDKSLAAKS